MLNVRQDPDNNILEVDFIGKVTEEDYRNTLIPALDEVITHWDNVRILARLGEDFEGFTVGAMLQDARMGFRNWNGFVRVAVVTGTSWVRHALAAFSVMMPCPVHVFALAEEQVAQLWLRESLGVIHQTDLGDGVLHLQLIGSLDEKAYDGEAEDMDAFIRRNDRFSLLLDLREFDGWRGLGAMNDHFHLAKDHVALVGKVAIVGTSGWQKLAERIGRHLVGKPVRYFHASEYNDAVAYLKST